MRIGVIACNVMKRELNVLLAAVPEVTEVIFLEIALHCFPQKMKEAI